MANLPDNDPQETQEWLDALESVLKNEGAERAHFLLGQLIDKARSSGAGVLAVRILRRRSEAA